MYYVLHSLPGAIFNYARSHILYARRTPQPTMRRCGRGGIASQLASETREKCVRVRARVCDMRRETREARVGCERHLGNLHVCVARVLPYTYRTSDGGCCAHRSLCVKDFHSEPAAQMKWGEGDFGEVPAHTRTPAAAPGAHVFRWVLRTRCGCLPHFPGTPQSTHRQLWSMMRCGAHVHTTDTPTHTHIYSIHQRQ